MSTEDPTLNFVAPRVAAGVLFTDEQDRVLMVVPSYKDYLDIPGGYVETGETPHKAAQREVVEELGVKPPIGRLLVADWWEDSPEADGGAKLLLVFDGGIADSKVVSSVTVDGDEVVGFVFRALDQVAELTIPRLANRISYALHARRSGETVYLECGLRAPAADSPA